jgi:hypothetical protein
MVFALLLCAINLKPKLLMITRLDPHLQVETPLGKGSAVFYIASNTQEDWYWVVDDTDKSIRLFNKFEIRILKETEQIIAQGAY